MSNAYNKLDRRLRGEEPEKTGPPPGSGASAGGHNGYIAPRAGYVPAHSTNPPQLTDTPSHSHSHERGRDHPPSSSASLAPEPAFTDSNHPLHLHYRKRIRGIRMRWFGSGILLGALIGIGLTVLVSALVVTQFPSVLQNVTGEPDVAVVIGETYLNREAASRLNAAPMTVANLQVTGLTLDLKPDNRMDLRPQFTADLLITKLTFTAAVENQLSVQDGQLVINMVGNPQIGDLNVPLQLLPFNLNDSTRQAVDKIDNDLIAAEINRTLSNTSNGTDFQVQAVDSTDSSMTIRMMQK